MYDAILVATDGSDHSLSAVAHALGLAETYDATVHALYVVDAAALAYGDEGDGFGDDAALVDALTGTGRRATGDVQRRAEERGLDAETAVLRGSPARSIRRYADEEGIDLIAMGTRGRKGLSRLVLGSVAGAVLGSATQPVLTARAAAARETDYDRILLPVDGSDRAERVADHAFGIADRYGATVHALSVIDTSLTTSPMLISALEAESEAALDAAERRGEDEGVDVVTRVWRGSPTDCITRYADQREVDLVAMATHGRQGLARFLSRRVAERVIRSADCPVLTLGGEGERERSGE